MNTRPIPKYAVIKMLRALIAATLICAVLVQTACPLVCRAILEVQNRNEQPVTCCSKRIAERADHSSTAPLDKPAGMPDEACCLKRGPLMARALVPDAPDSAMPILVVVLPELSDAAISAGTHPVVERVAAWRPPPSQPRLQVFRI